MSKASGTGNRLGILEWRHEGHRLGYVAAIARAATADGLSPILFTESHVRRTNEYRVHLTSLDGLIVRDLEAPITNSRSFLAALKGIGRNDVDGIVIPEVDTLLPALFIKTFLRRSGTRVSGIVMRPPRRGSTLRQAAWSVAKAALIRSDRLCPDLELLLLEDPLASGPDLVWPEKLLSPRRRLDDPSDLYSVADESALPAELQNLSVERPIVTIMGVIDHRKQIPLAIEAWKQARAGDSAYFIIAGKQRTEVTQTIQEAVAIDGSIVAVDRYLKNEEMGALIKRSTALLLLYDVGTSSGLLTTAASVGRWAIVRKDTRTGRIAVSNGFGIESDGSASAVARSMHEALRRTAPPMGTQLPTGSDFGRRVLEWHRSTVADRES